jgi:iron complex outermembrane receptor protein
MMNSAELFSVTTRSGEGTRGSSGRWKCRIAGFPVLLVALLGVGVSGGEAQETGTVRGTVILAESGAPAAGARVLIPRLGISTLSDEAGQYVLDGVPPGQHEVVAQRGTLQSGRMVVFVETHQIALLDLELSEAFQLEQLTVTASRSGLTTDRELFNSVTTLHQGTVAAKAAPTLAGVLEGEAGIAMRSFGPGAARPIIRGFDGDRVLILEDGLPTGDLSSQSGDHGTSVNPTSLRRVEVLKGPATLLYGTNAIGGVVNAITNHDYYRTPPPSGFRGGVTLDGATGNGQAGGNLWLQGGQEGWLYWGNGGYRRAGDYDSPEGTVPNSGSELANGSAGVGYFGPRAFFSLGASYETGEYGVPFAGEFEEHHDEGEEHEEEPGHEEEEIVLDMRRASGRANFGLVNLNGFVESLRGSLNFSDWHHEELHGGETGTVFDNLSLVFRMEADQARREWWGGSLGIWAKHRDYESQGEEALSPPVVHNSFAAFALEEFDLGKARVQVGGRLEWNQYNPDDPDLPTRTFSGISSSVGLNVPVSSATNIYTNLTESYRAPALEELYNFGPHVGTLTFEVGNPNLDRELALGLDVGVKHNSERWALDVSGYYYDIRDYVFAFLTGEEEDGLQVGEFMQADARYAGFEAGLDLLIASELWLNLTSDYVFAELKDDSEALPRIPPLRGRIGLDWHRGGLQVRPEVILVAEQDRVFTNETVTDGYVLAHLTGSYTLERGGQQHRFTVRLENVTDQLYRNHSSFIKDLAPEMGRSLKVSYSMQVF